MAGRWSVTSFVILGLLGYFVGMQVEAGLPFESAKTPFTPSKSPKGNENSQTLGQPLRAVKVNSPISSITWKNRNPSQSTLSNPNPSVGQTVMKTPTSNRMQQSLVSDGSQSSIPGNQKVPLNSQNPQNPLRPQVPLGQPELPSSEDSCAVNKGVRIECGLPGINEEECNALGCCYSFPNCFYRKTVTVQCTKGGQFIVVVAKDATIPKLNTDSISLLGTGPDCSYVDSNSAFAIFHFNVSSCGTIITEESEAIVYENSMSSLFEVDSGPLGAITRDSYYELLFQCRYTSSSVDVVVQELLRNADIEPIAALGPLRVALRLGNGRCEMKGCDEAIAAYNSYYTEADYPVGFVLREPVFVEVYVVDSRDPNYVLTLDRCWATNCPDAHSFPQWDILINGCPNNADVYTSALVPVPATVELGNHYRRFVFNMFTFVEQNVKNLRQEVYIHCTAALCLPNNGGCEPICMQRWRRDVSDVNQNKVSPNMVVSSGRIIISAPEE